MKLLDVISGYDKKVKYIKIDFRAVSILPDISQIYEEIIHNQLHDYFDNIQFSLNVDFVKDIICDTVIYLLSKNQWIQIARVGLF